MSNNKITMASQQYSDSKRQQAVLRIIKALTVLPAQVMFYGSTLLAVGAIGGADLPGVLTTLASTVGANLLANMLERVTRGDHVSDDEIRNTVQDAIRESGIDQLATSNELQRGVAHIFRQFDLLRYAVQKGEINIVATLTDQLGQHQVILEELQSELIDIHEQIKNLATRGQNEEILKSVREIPTKLGTLLNTHFSTILIDEKIEEEVDRIRKCRFFIEFDRKGSSLALASKLINGDFQNGTNSVRSRALAWCARILSAAEEIGKAEEYFRLAQELSDSDEVRIAYAFLRSQKGDKETALSVLADIDTPAARSATFMVVAHHEVPQTAVSWLNAAGVVFSDLDSDGKYYFIAQLHETSNWNAALEYVDALSDENLRETPVLNHIMAITHLVSTVPNEYREVVLRQIPFDVRDFPLASDDFGIEHRRKAHDYFVAGVQVALQLGLPNMAALEEDYALWLELRDPDDSGNGRRKLEAKLRDPKYALRLVHFGFQFGLSLELAIVEQEIERQIALRGGMTYDTAIAHFALAFKKPPQDAANHISRYRDEMLKFLDKRLVFGFEIEIFIRANLLNRANENLNLLIAGGLSEIEEGRFRNMISEAQGTDPIYLRKDQFKKTDSIADLVSLIEELGMRGVWDACCEYGQILYERTHSARDAERLVYALRKINKNERIVEILAGNRTLLSQSKNLQLLYCWALYDLGEVLQASSELGKLNTHHDDPSYRSLQVNLGITMGNWAFLSAFVTSECLEKHKRTAEELMGTAELALRLGLPNNAKDLAFTAVTKGSDNADILTAAYFLATSAGWEDDARVFEWLEKAATLSNEDGPIRRMTLKDIVDQKPEWDRRESGTWQMLSRGDIPMFIAAQSLNRSLIELMLYPALANQHEKDPRRRSAIPAYSGARQVTVPTIPSSIGIDATSLLTLGFVDLLDKAFAPFDTIYVPHSTLAWLFQEKQKASFHQPSRIRSAHRIRNLLATGMLEKFMSSTVPNSSLFDQVDDELAQFIAEAEKILDNETQRLVVQPSPVHRVRSFMEEEADLTSHEAVLCSCQSVIDKLRQKGQITAEEERKALAYLRLQEKPWPLQPEIADGAILYLSDVATAYFLHLGLLEKLRTAGLRPIVSPSLVYELDRLIAYESMSVEVNEVIERIRSTIHTLLMSGTVRIGKNHYDKEYEDRSISEHPTLGIIALTKVCDALIVDDRFLNQHTNFQDGNVQRPIYSTLDLLDTLSSTGAILPESHLEYRSLLRRAGYFFIPVNENELAGHLNASNVKDNQVVETAELKAIRENILRIRMSTWLQLPKEAPWLDGCIRVLIQVLQGLWKPDVNFSDVRARSDWIIDQVDVRGWAHTIGGENGDNFVKTGRGAYILMLLAPLVDTPREVKESYWNWIEDRILRPIKEQFPDLYSWIVDWQKRQIAKLSDMDPATIEKNEE